MVKNRVIFCCCEVVYNVCNDVTRDSIACSLTLRHVTENRYVKYPVHKIAGKRMNIKKIKLYLYEIDHQILICSKDSLEMSLAAIYFDIVFLW